MGWSWKKRPRLCGDPPLSPTAGPDLGGARSSGRVFSARLSWCGNLLFPSTKNMKRHGSGFKKLSCGGPGMPVPCGAEFVAPQTRRHKLKRVSDRGSDRRRWTFDRFAQNRAGERGLTSATTLRRQCYTSVHAVIHLCARSAKPLRMQRCSTKGCSKADLQIPCSGTRAGASAFLALNIFWGWLSIRAAQSVPHTDSPKGAFERVLRRETIELAIQVGAFKQGLQGRVFR